MGRIRLISLGAVLGLAWAACLRGFMQQLAGPTSTFTFTGTFGVIIPTGVAVGALIGWAEHQRRIGRPIWLLIFAPLLIGIIPTLAGGELDFGPHRPRPGRDDRRLRPIRPWPAVDQDRGRHCRPLRRCRNFPRPQALPVPQLHHPAGRLVRHPGRVSGRGPHPRLLHPDAPRRHGSRPGRPASKNGRFRDRNRTVRVKKRQPVPLGWPSGTSLEPGIGLRLLVSPARGFRTIFMQSPIQYLQGFDIGRTLTTWRVWQYGPLPSR